MNLILTRKEFTADGVFGELTDDKFIHICLTLEHAYIEQDADGNFNYKPKLPNGEYTCKRGSHQLEGMEKPFETFEVINVPGHTGILFHIGNYNHDSSGCILLGTGMGHMSNGGKMIVFSKTAFAYFLSITQGMDVFTLTVQTD